MKPLPTQDLRSNVGTWAVPTRLLPAVAAAMYDSLAAEPFDPPFRGQELATTYFDTPGFTLRKARSKGKRYLTLRVREYPKRVFALSAKTEKEKFRAEIAPEEAEALARGNASILEALLPADLLARLLALTDAEPLLPVATVRCRRYAVEDKDDRLTLDTDVETDTGKCLGTAVLEFKSAVPDAPPPLAGG